MSVPTPILQYNLSDASVKGLLPSGYTPLAYIEFTGTQYLNTGITFNAGTDGFEVECLSTDTSQNGMVLASDSGGYTWLYDYAGSGKLSLYIRSSSGQEHLSGPPQDLCKHHCLYINRKYYGDGTHYGTMSGNNSTGSVIKIGDYGGSYRYKGKIYYVRLWNNGTLVRDMRPCYNSSGTTGMYDLVGRTFYTNQGSGTILQGPELAVGKGGGKSLPEEYLLVEYLEGTGYLYIDTGMKASNMTKTELDFSLTLVNNNSNNLSAGWNGLICADSISYKYDVYINPSKLFRNDLYGTMNNITSYTVPLNTKINVIKDGGKFYVDGTLLNTITDTNALTSSNNIFLMASNYTGYSAPTHHLIGKVYHCKITENGTIVRHFFPCYRKSDMKPGMYDTVNGVFYTNAGSGEFILGPSINAGYTSESNAGILTPCPYDPTIYYEPDGSAWVRIYHCNNPSNTSNLFSSGDSFNTGVKKNDNAWFAFHLCNLVNNGLYEFLIKQKTTSSASETKWRWIQFYNPLTCTYNNVHNNIIKNLNGYSNDGNNRGGLFSSSSNIRLKYDDNTNGSDWFGLGSWTAYQGGYPAYGQSVVTTGYEDCYLRIPDLQMLHTGTSCEYDSLKNFTGYFNGSAYIEAPSYQPSSTFSIACWVKTSTTNTWKRIFWNGPASTAWVSGRWIILINNSNNCPIFAVSDGSTSTSTYCTGITNVCNGVWHHIVGTYNSGTMKLYVDGNLEKTYTTNISPVANTATRISGSSAGERHTGLICNCMLFDVCLTDTLVKELYGK